MRFEDNILAYLDGSLDEESRAELLHTLSVSPEKRAVLEEHLRLRELMMFGHKPLNVPLATERALANRIAALGQEMPHLVDDVAVFTSGGLLAGAFQSISSAFSLSAVRLAVGSLAVGAVIWFAASRNPDVASNAIESRQQFEATRSSNGSLPLSANSTLAANTSEGKSGILAEESSSGAGVRASRARTGSRQHSAQNAINSFLTKLSSDAATTEAPTSALSVGNELSNQTNRGAANTDIAQSDAASINTAGIEVATIASVTPPRTTPESSDGLKDLASSEDNLAHAPIRYESDQDSHTGRFSAWVGYGLQQSFGATFAGNASAAAAATSSPAIGLDYHINDRLELGIESGQGNYTRIESHVKAAAIVDQPRVYHVQYSASVINQSSRWIRATFGLGLFSIDKVHVSANAGLGAAFSNGPSPMISGSAIVTYDLFQRVGFNAQFSYSGVWLSPLASQDWRGQIANGANAVGILSDPVSSRTLLTPAFDLFIGLRYSF
jgi:hypothetical protein